LVSVLSRIVQSSELPHSLHLLQRKLKLLRRVVVDHRQVGLALLEQNEHDTLLFRRQRSGLAV
jgi:hypothetical protein